MSKTARQFTGCLIILGAVFVLDPSQASVLHQFWLPILIGLGGYLVTGSSNAVALAALTLSLINLDGESDLWYRSYGYLSLIIVSSAILLFNLFTSFRKEIDATRALRLAGRQERSKSKVERGPLLEGQSAIVFDFDGTLAPNLDLPEMRRRVLEYSLTFGVPEVLLEPLYIVEIIDRTEAFLIEKNTESTKIRHYRETAEKLILDIELEEAGQNMPFDGVAEMLASLRSDGFKIGIVTRNCREAVLKTFPGIEVLTDAIHARDDVDYLKPDQRHVKISLEALGVEPASALMVGDGLLDMEVGKSVGLKCVGVLTGSNTLDQLEAAGADIVLPSVLSLVESE